MSYHEKWPILEFSALKPSILSRFSTGAGESVCELLIKEIVENVDRPSSVSQKILIENDQELEWIMQFINHAFDLSFYSDSTYRTLSSAVRIYLAWMTALTSEPHKCCPEPLRVHPDRYFRKMIEAFRKIFIPKTLPSTAETELALCHQGNEIRTILTAIRHLTLAVLDDFKDEVWSRSLLFLMAVIDQLLSKTKTKDEIGCLMSNDLSHALFDCWVKAAILEYIPSPSYWQTLSELSWKWIPHVLIVECWARKLLLLTVLVVQNQYGTNYCNIQINDQNLLDAFRVNGNIENLKNVWLNMFQLMGNPAHFFQHSETLLEYLPLDASNFAYFNGRSALSFFLSVSAFCKIIDIFYGDSNVSIDFHECDELQAQWSDTLSAHDEKKPPKLLQRFSNLSYTQTVPNLPNTISNSIHQSSQNLNYLANEESTFQMPSKKSAINSVLHQDYSHYSEQLLNHGGSVKNLTGIHQNGGRNNSTNFVTQQSPDVSAFPSHPSAGQLVWYILKSNRLSVFSLGNVEKAPKSSVMLSVFMEWLFEASTILLTSRHLNNKTDIQSEKSLNVDAVSNAETGQQNSQSFTQPLASSSSANLSGGSGSQPSPIAGSMYARSGTHDEVISLGHTSHEETTWRSFATQSTASSSDLSAAHLHHSNLPNNNAGNHSTIFDFPSVDGVAAGRASALGALCKIVCAKSSEEKLSDDQLSHFYLVLHEALFQRDRLMLCSLLYYSVDLFKLGLPGIDILLPNYLSAIDIILTESMKLRLHPSIPEAEMRNACLRALSTIIGWPTTFGTDKIIGEDFNNFGKLRSKLLNSFSTNSLELNLTYLDLRPKIMGMLLQTLRNETDVSNLQLALGLSYVFCLENVRYDISQQEDDLSKLDDENLKKANASESPEKNDEEKVEKCFAVSVLRGVVSAVCDNLSKPQWVNDLTSSLAALDCLNCLATLPHSIIFYNGDLSTGSLIVTSLCRFVDNQLQKPPMYHSRDLHSSIVMAYFTLANWISYAPALTEVESYLSTLSQIIEFGMTGGKALEQSQYKPASQRVYDAAEYLLNFLFSLNTTKKKSFAATSLLVGDECWLAHKFGKENVDTNNFKYFLINENSIISLHEAQHIYSISNGLPTVLAVVRTPFCNAHSFYFQLQSKTSFSSADTNVGTQNGLPLSANLGSLQSQLASTLTTSEQSQVDQRQKTDTLRSKAGTTVAVNDNVCFGNSEPIKQFVFPPGLNKIQCKLDTECRSLEPNAEVQVLQDKLEKIMLQLESGSTGSEFRDQRNIWVQSPLGKILSQPPKPENAVEKCDSMRVFLYDFGLVNRTTFGKSFVPLNFVNDRPLFLNALHTIVDKTPVCLAETAFVFYVRNGQRSPQEILRNCENLEETSAEFCGFLNDLGRGVDLSHGFLHWSGNWKTAFTKNVSNEKKASNKENENFELDGIKNCLYWQNAQIEIAFLTPTSLTVPVRQTSISSTKASQMPSKHSNLLTSLNKFFVSDDVNSIENNIDTKNFSIEEQESLIKTQNDSISNKKLKQCKSFNLTLNNNLSQLPATENKDLESKNETVRLKSVRMNSIAASIFSFFSKTALSSGSAANNNHTTNNDESMKFVDNVKDVKKTKINVDNTKILKSEDQLNQPENFSNPIFKPIEPEKKSMLVFRKLTQANVGLMHAREVSLQKSMEEISLLEQEYQMNVCKKPEEIIKSSMAGSEQQEQSLPNISAGFSKWNSLHDSLSLSSTNISSSLNSERQKSKLTLKSFMPQKELTSYDSVLPTFSSFDNLEPPVIFSKDKALTVYTTTIIKAETVEKPSISMAQAKSVTVKSARFSRNNCKNFLSNAPISPLSSISSSNLLPLMPAQSVISNSTEIKNINISSTFLKKMPECCVSTESLVELAKKEKKSNSSSDVIVLSPFSETTVEFPIIAGQQPLPCVDRISDSRSLLSAELNSDIIKKNKSNDLLNLEQEIVSCVAFDTLSPPQDQTNKSKASNLPNLMFLIHYLKSIFKRKKLTEMSVSVSESSIPKKNSSITSSLSCIFQEKSNDTKSQRNLKGSKSFKEKIEANEDVIMPNSCIKENILEEFHAIEKVNINLNCSIGDRANAALNAAPMASVIGNNDTRAVDANSTLTTITSRNSDVSFAGDGASSAWQLAGLPLSGGPKSNAWSNWPFLTPVSMTGEQCPAEKVIKRSPDFRILIVWLERVEDMYYFPFDQLLPYTDDGSNALHGVSSRRFSSLASANSQQTLRSDFMIIYLCNVEPGLVRVHTEGVWIKKFGQPTPLIDGMVVPSEVLAPLIQQTICSIARRKMVEVENYQMNQIRRRQSILDFGRKFAIKLDFDEFIEEFVN